MDVVSAEDMRQQGMNNVDEILSNVSNVFINKSSDGMRITLRGLADSEGLNNSNQHTSSPTVAVNVDGAYNSNSNAGQNLFDVERVEVLFGPQSTMYSSNSPGGIVNVVTASPKTDKYSVSGSADIGNYGKINAQTAVNVPVLQDKFALRVAGSYSKRDSYISGSDSSTAEDTIAGRLKALYQVNDDLSVTVTGNLSERGGGGGMGGAVEAFGDESEMSDPWTASENTAGGMNTSDETTEGISGNIDWNTPYGGITFTSSYNSSESSSREEMEIMGDPGEDSTWDNADNESKNTQKSAELRMTSPDDFLFKWIFGANYYESWDERSIDYDEESTIDTHSINTQESKALYGNITYPVTETFRATVGYRRSWDETENNTVEANGPGGVSDGTPTISSMDYSNPDYKIGFEYDMAENVMLYADRSTSFRINSMGMSNEAGDYPDPEELVSYTIGAKTRFLDNKLQLNVSAFLYDYKNKQANQNKEARDIIEKDYGVDIDGDGEIEDIEQDFHDSNSQGYGEFESYGVDIQANWIITNKDKLGLSVSYLHSEWTDLEFDYEYDVLFAPESFNGVENIYAPNWTVNLSYDHNFNLWNGGTLTGHIDGLYSDDFILSWNHEEDYPYNYQEAYTLWNASVSYNPPSSNWSVNAYVKNIFEYAVKTSYMDAGGGNSSMGIGDPRTFGAVFSFNF
jgi:iron complex outermembrane receptor protein